MTKPIRAHDMLKIIIYDILILAFVPYLIMRYIFKHRLVRFFRRIFSFQIESQATSPIWLHAVSVGEVVALRGIVDFLKEHFPQYPLVITTITPSGLKVAQDNFAHTAYIALLPLDLSLFSKKAVEKIRPRIFIAIETEIWPNLYCFLKKRGTPIVIINGRISDRSFVNYKRVNVFLREYFEAVDFVFAKDETSRRRFIALGTPSDRISVMGNIKFIKPTLNHNKLIEIQNICESIKQNSRNLLLLAASTHFPEEEIIMRVFDKLKTVFSTLRLIVCPRHIERSGEILEVAKKLGRKALLLSQSFSPTADIVILDRIGELLYFYPYADIVFMGGSLAPVGGHNIIEPAFFGRPIVFGPHMDNFRTEERIFIRNNAAWQISSAQDLEEVLDKLIKEPQLRLRLGDNAQRLVENEAEKLKGSLVQLKRWIR